MTEQLGKFPNAGIIIFMLGIFISFGLLANLYDGETLLYNVLQGFFMAFVVGGALVLARFGVRRHRRQAGQGQPNF